MTLEELKIKLQAFNVPTNLYSITTGGLPNERLCIINEGGMWQVYYSERGIREFDTYGIMPIPSNKAIATPTGEFFCQILRIY